MPPRLRPMCSLWQLLLCIIAIGAISTFRLLNRWDSYVDVTTSLAGYYFRQDQGDASASILSPIQHKRSPTAGLDNENKKIMREKRPALDSVDHVERANDRSSRRAKQEPEPSETSATVIMAIRDATALNATKDLSQEITRILPMVAGDGSPVTKSANRTHNPQYFSTQVPLAVLIERGNLVTVHTGCNIATWSYNGQGDTYRPFNDCRQHAKSAAELQERVITEETAADKVEDYDSIYVPVVKLEHFVNTTLPRIQHKFVLLSGQNSKPPYGTVPWQAQNVILEHPLVTHWFLQNLNVYATNPSHTKFRPFPYGVHPMALPMLLEEMRNDHVKKNNTIFLSWYKYSNVRKRSHIPPRERVSTKEYLKRLHLSNYVCSPDGDRQECHRHYEAIALGCMPITQLTRYWYHHFGTNVLYETTSYNLTELEATLPPSPKVNRRLVFNEYWMEYVEREVGRPMRWWDSSRNVRCLLEEIQSTARQNATKAIVQPNAPLVHKARRAPAATKLATVDDNRTHVEKLHETHAKQLLRQTNKAKVATHFPNYFTDIVPLEKLIERKSLLTVYTGCSIATWTYGEFFDEHLFYHPLNDCIRHKGWQSFFAHKLNNATISKIEEYDSIYVPIASLTPFISNILPRIETQFVLVSGQRSLVPPIPRDQYDALIQHPRIIRWFLQNLSVYAYDPSHPKLAPFPYGMAPVHTEQYLAEMKRNSTKDELVFVSFITRTNNWRLRRLIPSSKEKLPEPDYWKRMHESHYVLSPNGDRPECHRHYEAIGLGTTPITSLDPQMYRHLLGNVVFDDHKWNLTEFEATLPRSAEVNRRLVFEEYWMEYIEREVGHPMRWWDSSRELRCSLDKITQLVKDTPTEDERHFPSYFTEQAPLKKLVKRANLLTVFTGCSIATWSFNGRKNNTDIHSDCQRYNGWSAYEKHRITNETVSQIQAYDSIYVTITALEQFVDSILPYIETEFVLITGQNSYVPGVIPSSYYRTLIWHPRIVHWFLQNLSTYARGRHPKLSPWPYGMNPRYMKQTYLNEMLRNETKATFIYEGFFTERTNEKARKGIPKQYDRLPEQEYWSRIHKSHYILSPDGDRPECHRHYEAIGLGCMPITSLDSHLHRHLKGNVVYAEHHWNLTELEKKLDPEPVVNRRLVFEEYWMEYVERIVGRPMRWWDPKRYGVRCSLGEITNIVKSSAT